MSQADIDAFVESAKNGKLTPEGVTTAVVTRGIPVNGQHSGNDVTALYWAVYRQHHELIEALLAAGAHPAWPRRRNRSVNIRHP
jgi:ankyrin repeat protein